MHPLEKKTLKAIRQEYLLLAGEKVVIGVSGGPDSMALLHVLAHLAPVLHITPAALYVNHGLRPAEAAVEKNLVAAESTRLGLDFFTGAVNVKALAAKEHISIEHAARLLRYDLLEQTAQTYGAEKIALAHTADDQAEELLLRLIRGTARKGLSGMKTLRAGKFIRPFLTFYKSEILSYLETCGIPFQTDSSNRQNIYRRNRVRNELLPYLAERYNPDIRQTLVRTAIILQDEEELLATMTEAAFTGIVSSRQDQTAKNSGSPFKREATAARLLQLKIDRFSMQPRAIQRRVLEKCCWCMGCEPRARQIAQLLQLATPGAAGCLHLADGLRVVKSDGQLLFSYPQGRGPLRGSLSSGPPRTIPETAIPGPGWYDFPALEKRLLVDVIEEPGQLAEGIFSGGEYLDGDLFSFPLTLRPPRPGDRFHPLGAPGTRKVADFLSDRKIERSARPLVPVLCNEDSILALPGLRIDHYFRITATTTRFIRVRWESLTKISANVKVGGPGKKAKK